MTTFTETMRSLPIFPSKDYPTFTYWLGHEAAEYLGYYQQVFEGEWEPKYEKVKKGEHEPRILATPRALHIYWKSGVLIIYVDMVNCLENQTIDDCVIVRATVIDNPPEDKISDLLDLWGFKSIETEVKRYLEYLKINPGYRKRKPKTPQKRVAPRDE